MPDIYLLIGGQQQGPYPDADVRRFLAEGRVQSDVLAWHEGMAEWIPLTEVLSKESAPAAETPSEVKVKRQSPPVEKWPWLVDDKLEVSEKANSKMHAKRFLNNYLKVGLAIFAGLVVLGMSVGMGVGLVLKGKAPSVKTDSEGSVMDGLAKYNEASKKATPINVVASDEATYMFRYIVFAGRISISSYYNTGEGYGDARQTHYSFSIHDDTGEAKVYGLKSGIGAQLRDELLKQSKDGTMNGVFTVRLTERSRIGNQYGELDCELENYQTLVPAQ